MLFLFVVLPILLVMIFTRGRQLAHAWPSARSRHPLPGGGELVDVTSPGTLLGGFDPAMETTP